MVDFCFAGLEGFSCNLFYIGLVVIFFISAIAHKQLGDLFDVSFNTWTATGTGAVTMIVVVFFTTTFKWIFLAGFIGMIIGGFIGGLIISSAGGEVGFD